MGHTTTSQTNRLLIVPGHGGPDRGAVSEDGLEEAAYVLMIARMLRARLAAMKLPDLVFDLSRDDDEHAHAPWYRAKMAKNFNADLVLSLHLDSLPASPKTYGTKIYYWPDNRRTHTIAVEMADAVPFPLHGWWTVRDATAKEFPNVHACLQRYHCDALLIELGYLSSPLDLGNLRNPLVQDGLVHCLIGGVLHWRMQRASML